MARPTSSASPPRGRRPLIFAATGLATVAFVGCGKSGGAYGGPQYHSDQVDSDSAASDVQEAVDASDAVTATEDVGTPTQDAGTDG